jgi:hypothetical protein
MSKWVNHYATHGIDPTIAKSKPKAGKLVAQCTSELCCQYEIPQRTNGGEPILNEDGSMRVNRKYHSFIIKEVKKSVDYCPDCGHALFWDRV